MTDSSFLRLEDLSSEDILKRDVLNKIRPLPALDIFNLVSIAKGEEASTILSPAKVKFCQDIKLLDSSGEMEGGIREAILYVVQHDEECKAKFGNVNSTREYQKQLKL